jgi:hypothetical protein
MKSIAKMDIGEKGSEKRQMPWSVSLKKKRWPIVGRGGIGHNAISPFYGTENIKLRAKTAQSHKSECSKLNKYFGFLNY